MTVIDVTIRVPVATGGGDTKAGAAAALGYRDKVRFYQERYKIPTTALIPFAVETRGYLGAAAVEYLKFIAASIVESRSVYCHRVRYFYQRIGVAIQSGNADIITVWRRNIAAPAPAVAPAAHGGV